MGWTADAVAAQAADNVVMPNDDRPADLADEATAQELLRRGLDRDAVALALRTIRRDLDLDTSRPEEASMSMTHADVDLEAVKARQQGMWASGNYAVIGTTLQITGESLCQAVDVQAGERVLDVAAGNAALAAARRGCEVTSDYVVTVLEATQARATSEGLDINCRQADAESLPFPEATESAFDVVL